MPAPRHAADPPARPGYLDGLALRAGGHLRTASYLTGPLGAAVMAWLLSYGPASGWFPFGVGVLVGVGTAVFQIVAARLSAIKSRLEAADEAAASAETARPINALAVNLDAILRTSAEAAPRAHSERSAAFSRWPNSSSTRSR